MYPDYGPITRPAVPEGKRIRHQLGRLIDLGPHQKDQADGVGEQQTSPVAVQDELGRLRQRRELFVGTKDKRQTGEGRDYVVYQKRQLRQRDQLGDGFHRDGKLGCCVSRGVVTPAVGIWDSEAGGRREWHLMRWLDPGIKAAKRSQ